MAEPVSLSDIKTHLRLSQGVTSEDALLTSMIVAARRFCEARINRNCSDLDEDDLALAVHAIRLIVGQWYGDRQAGGPVPAQVDWLLAPLCKWATD